MVSDTEDLYELVIYRDPELADWKCVFMTHPHLNEWRTRDLFRKHTTEDLWAFVGRRDDVIVLSTGEKFNPVTMEDIIQGHSKVSGALVVPLNRPHCALVLEVRESSIATEIIDEV